MSSGSEDVTKNTTQAKDASSVDRTKHRTRTNLPSGGTGANVKKAELSPSQMEEEVRQETLGAGILLCVSRRTEVNMLDDRPRLSLKTGN